jgi:hypothetical protein
VNNNDGLAGVEEYKGLPLLGLFFEYCGKNCSAKLKDVSKTTGESKKSPYSADLRAAA